MTHVDAKAVRAPAPVQPRGGPSGPAAAWKEVVDRIKGRSAQKRRPPIGGSAG